MHVPFSSCISLQKVQAIASDTFPLIREPWQGVIAYVCFCSDCYSQSKWNTAWKLKYWKENTVTVSFCPYLLIVKYFQRLCSLWLVTSSAWMWLNIRKVFFFFPSWILYLNNYEISRAGNSSNQIYASQKNINPTNKTRDSTSVCL